MKIISIINQKGGVAKTTSAITIAVGLAKENKKVLLVDFDPQANATTGLGIDKLDLKYTVYDLLKADQNTHFYTNSFENSFIKASLKDEKTFILKSYMIRGNKDECDNVCCDQLKNWKLEGQKASDGEWILLDRHSNEPFDQLVVKTFNVSCEEKLKTVRLTQEGKDTSNSYFLRISAFDIFGVLIYE